MMMMLLSGDIVSSRGVRACKSFDRACSKTQLTCNYLRYDTYLTTYLKLV